LFIISNVAWSTRRASTKKSLPTTETRSQGPSTGRADANASHFLDQVTVHHDHRKTD
jgi:hypothetical protein